MGVVEKRKVCILGASGVGKTSLVARFVRSIFSDTYRTTLGVAIDKRRVRCDGRPLDLVIWDLSGEDEFQQVNLAYVRGAGGLLVVVDGTRRATAETALHLLGRARAIEGDAPCVLVLNKSDLVDAWDIDAGAEARLASAGCPRIATSAKTGTGVEEAFGALARAMMGGDPERTSRDA